MSLKARHDRENKIHECLYNNLYLLSQTYPTSADFNRIFKPDMFVKSNKAAFHEVVYYLFSILTTEESKEKITTWPPYDIQREKKFRTEVLSYVNELNSMFDYADIPHIMHSSLISPGGFKFTKFMLKLSEFVVFHHLKKLKAADLYCPVYMDNSEFLVNFLNKHTVIIDSIVQDQLNEFNNYYSARQNQATEIVNKLTVVNKTIADAKKKNEIVKKEFNEKYPLYPSPEYLHEKMQYLQKEWRELQPIHDIYKTCGGLLNSVKNNKIILEHKKEELQVPNEIIHIIKNRDELDLIELFQGLNILLEHRALAPDNLTKYIIDSNIQQINEMNLRYINLIKKFTQGQEKISKSIQDVLSYFKVLEDLNSEFNEKTLLCE